MTEGRFVKLTKAGFVWEGMSGRKKKGESPKIRIESKKEIGEKKKIQSFGIDLEDEKSR